MCRRKLNEIKLTRNRREIGGAIFERFCRASTLLPILLILLFISINAFAQTHAVYNVQPIIKDVKSKYGLTTQDLNRLIPLIKQENFEILTIYATFGDSENSYSPKLWIEIIDRRCEFDARIKGKLTKRQESALRTVRTEMEEQILNDLVEQYITFLSDYLELEPFQFDRINDLFFKEYKRKHRLITKNLSNIDYLQTELDSISRETESEIERILTPMQFRQYLTLSAQDEFIAE
jgi:hypothetical protein